MLGSALRFSIRDVLWLMLVVALVFGHSAREREHLANVRQIREDAKYADGWRVCAESLGELLADEGWIVEWDTKRVAVKVVWRESNATPRTVFTSMETGGLSQP